MKNFKKLLIAGFVLGMVPQVALPMKRATEVWEYIKEKSPIKIKIIRSSDDAPIGEPQRESIIHPDIEAFLRKELAKKSSLSEQELSGLIFEELPRAEQELRNVDMLSRFNISLTSLSVNRAIRTPNLEEFFNTETTDGKVRLIEIPDEGLSENIKTKKFILKGILKHEEGHCYHKHNPLGLHRIPCWLITTAASIKLATKLAPKIRTIYTGSSPLLIGTAACSTLAYSLSTSQISKYHERQADKYAIDHIEDPMVLRQTSKFFAQLALEQKSLSKIANLIAGSHPSNESRAKRFLQAAEKLEKQAKDHD